MAGKRQKSGEPSRLLGAILILLLLIVVIWGSVTVLKAAKAQKERAEAIKAPAQTQSAAVQQDAQADSQNETEPESENETEPEAQTPIAAVPAGSVTLMAVGDNLIHNCVYWSAEKKEGGYDFSPFYEKISETCAQYDLACINQETIFVCDSSYISSYPVFGTPIEMADALAGAGFDIVTHATNHCFDKGDTGLRDTIGYWRENHPEITYLGIHDTEQDAAQIRIVEKNGIRIALLNYTYGLNGGFSLQPWQINCFSTYAQIEQDLANAKAQADFVIVFAHWGEDGNASVTSYQKTWAQVLADAGADLSIGTHPHLLQPLEHLSASDGRDVPVFWSLGNFLSHQEKPEEMLGGMADVEITKDATGTYLSRCELQPTVTVIFRASSGDWYEYSPMLLRDYTEEIAARHRWETCTVDKMWEIYETATGEKRP
ncbi:MAG: CapA family protein [Clostridia bacterium]|nr:CapA family protein [Clostridia bacterium]